MSIVTVTRFTIEPANAQELVARHAALVKATKSPSSGLTEARIGKIDDANWVAVWRWESGSQLEAAQQNPPVEAAAAFALAINPTVEVIHIVDER